MTAAATDLHICVAQDPVARAQCLALRRVVFIVEQGVSEADENDGLDDACLHILASLDGRPVGTARVLPMQTIAKIQRVCILKAMRGTGAGARLMTFALDLIRRDGRFEIARLGSQTYALDFYRKLGFRDYGAEYLDAGIPHRDMELAL